TGAPKGCVLTHGNYRAGVDMVTGRDVLDGERDLVYLFLPLAHSFALLIQMAALDAGTPTAYWTGDPGRILDDLRDSRPTFLPSVPRVFEKAYGALTAGLDPATLARACAVGGEVQR